MVLTALLKKLKQYDLDDIFNMDETALFYNMPPITTIARERIEGRKKNKVRLTVALTCNATGTERLDPFFIGHANKPRCFNKKTGEELGFFYRHNIKAWMTGKLFREYLLRFNRYIKCPVILLIDNVSSHTFDDLFLNYVKVRTLPPHTTSKLQPLDAGIIAAFKKHYHRIKIRHGLDAIERGEEPYKINQLTAMRWIRRA